ncbi:ribosome biogenesis protein SLX9 homolog [Cynoglossus semilaevis]|uniref:SLX9 ribosome biogenesis factor n=1 Tax=Cynoglossus semilaevis TaxID=244447 RepID=A0A3P8W314_CYNSE|nr:protein FAM207A [Cynoglossus semilaevis]
MVGKIKRVRQKLHQEAVKPEETLSATSSLFSLSFSSSVRDKKSDSTAVPEENKSQSKQAPTKSSFPTGIFAGTKITPEALVQTLKYEETLDVQIPVKKGPEEKKLKTKKEKMKERREKWLNKISSIKLAREQQAATARRKATPVVGDLRPLADALPELCQLLDSPTAMTASARRKRRKDKVQEKKPEPTDFSQMKASQKRKFLETEYSRFSTAVKSISAKSNPLSDIGEQLRKRMKQEEEQSPT